MNPHRLQPTEIAQKARAIRRRVLAMNSRAGMGHTGADLSEADMLASLYFRILDVAPNRLDDPDRDRFILSKGHGAAGYYCTLAEAGFFALDELDTYLAFDSRLPGHPVRGKTPGVELCTGGLGHGLSVGVGLALAAKMSQRSYRTVVLMGDGELQEGSVWEAAMAAAQFRLDNLIAIVDRNRLQLGGRTEDIVSLEPLADKWAAFGFAAHTTDGNDPAAFVATMESITPGGGKPHVVLATTIKGKGVSFIENQPSWHHRVPTQQELAAALKELD
jgi:transketolase